MTWKFCARCDLLFQLPSWRREQRFCSQACALLHRYHGAEDEMADPLQPVADRCAKFIRACGDKRGVAPHELARYVDAYRALAGDDRFRVNVLVCRMPGVAYSSDDEDFRFWPVHLAPASASSKD